MKVLIVGGGGREHAIAWKLSLSPYISELYAAPGNAGISSVAKCIGIKSNDISSLLSFAKENKIGLTVVGPEEPLSLGIVNLFEKNGERIFGPRKEAAMIESSKVFAKEIMKKNKIPTADYEIFYDIEVAISYVKSKEPPFVIKADGLAAGKGVFVVQNKEEAISVIKKIMGEKIFGEAGNKIIIEDCLKGEEVSFLGISDGENILPLIPAQDHKRVYDEDKGLNTGGMGAYAPIPFLSKEIIETVHKKILLPLLYGLKEIGIEYKGVLYAGLMLTEDGPKVLEFNCRFGDPETQPILMLLKTDLLELIESVLNTKLKWRDGYSVCVVLASSGYPGNYEKGKEIKIKIENRKDIEIFHAGTKFENGKLLTDGGRVLGVTSIGKNLDSARKTCYNAISKIYFEGMHYRKDIGLRGLKKNEIKN